MHRQVEATGIHKTGAVRFSFFSIRINASTATVSAGLACLALLVCVSAAFTKPAGDTGLVDKISLSKADVFPSGIYLAKLEAIGPSSLRIVHVYAGPSQLNGTTFESDSYSKGGREWLMGYLPMGSAGLQQPLRRGDVGLFLLREDDRLKKLSVLSPDAVSGFSIAPLIQEHKQFKRWLELADIVEEIYRTTDDARLRKIDQFVKCDNVAKSYTAFWYLRESKEHRLLDYMLELTAEKAVPIEVQMDLNDCLRAKKKGWSNSTAELELTTRWFREPWKGTPEPRGKLETIFPLKLYYLTSNEEEALGGWFANAAAGKRYSATQLVDLALKGLANPTRSSDFKEKVLCGLKYGTSNTWESKEIDEGFSHLVRQVKRGAGTSEKAVAARLLVAFAPLDAGQRNELQALLAANPDEAVANQLRMILDGK